MIQLNFLNAVAEDYGNGLIVNGKDLTSIISAALGSIIKRIPTQMVKEKSVSAFKFL